MKKTTIQVSWDVNQMLNRLASELAEIRKEKITKDQTIRFLLNEYRKEEQK